jgi:hypothetical protein
LVFPIDFQNNLNYLVNNAFVSLKYNIKLGDLKEGECRRLKTEEIKKIKI